MWRAPCTITMSVVVAFLAEACPARTIHVPAEQPTIQAGIDAAVAGDEVLVADGEYTGLGNRDITFGGKAVTLRSANGPEKCIINCQGTMAENHRGLLFSAGEGPDTVVDGFTVANGHVGIDTLGGEGGAGILCSNASPTIRNCIIGECTVASTIATPGMSASGGGIFCSKASPTIHDCVISRCTAHTTTSGIGFALGGGIYCGGPAAAPTITDCLVMECSVSTTATSPDDFPIAQGGGIHWDASDGGGQIVGCRLSGNSAQSSPPTFVSSVFGGGARLIGNVVMTGCLISENSAVEGGGGVTLSGAEMTDCAISGNFANFGGGVSAGEGTLVRDCLISGNTAFEGGGFYCGDATFLRCLVVGNVGDHRGGGGVCSAPQSPSAPQAQSTIDNCLVIGNSAVDDGDGGGVYCSQGLCFIINSTIASNFATRGGGVGVGAPFQDDTDAALSNCVVVNNESVFGGDELAVATVTTSSEEQASLSVNYSNVEGGAAAVTVAGLGATLLWGNGNIDADPLFVDPDGPDDINSTEDDDYRLAAGSPCIDAASNPAVLRGVTEDLGGNPRFQDDPATTDTGLGRAPIVDMGAYEFQPLDPADLDGDGDVDGFDLAILLAAWGPCRGAPAPGSSCPTDLDGDGDTDGFDLAMLLANWT